MSATTSQISDAEIFATARKAFPHVGRIGLETFVVAGSSKIRLRLLTTYHEARWRCEAEASGPVELLLLLRSMTPKLRGPRNE